MEMQRQQYDKPGDPLDDRSHIHFAVLYDLRSVIQEKNSYAAKGDMRHADCSKNARQFCEQIKFEPPCKQIAQSSSYMKHQQDDQDQ